MKPRIQSALIETASPASDNDAPKAGTVFVVGSAGAGPTTPVIITHPTDAYRLYGREGKLAQTVELALQGARIGAQIAGNGVHGRVVSLRTETGDRASVSLQDNNGNVVMKITTSEASDRANDYRISPISSGSVGGYSIYDPTQGDAGITVDIPVSFTGQPTPGTIATPSALAEAIRTRFRGRLSVEVFFSQAHFELEISSETEDSDNLPIVTSSTQGRTTLDMSGLALSDAQDLAAHSLLFVDREKANAILSGDAKEWYKRIVAEDNEDARFYSVTAGRPVVAPKGTSQVTINRMAPSRVIGQEGIRSLINIRTTGIGAAQEVDFMDATERGSDKVSEAYFRLRRDPIGRFRSNEMQTTHNTEAVYAIPFEAPNGIADEGGPISTAYAATQTSMTADEASTDRLGDKPEKVLRLFARELSGSSVREIALSLQPGQDGLAAELEWDDSTGLATLYINKDEFDAQEGTALDEGELFVSYDTCVFDLIERTPSQLNPGSTAFEYAVNGTRVTFNRTLEHDLVVRPMTITHYRIGDGMIIERTPDGNRFHFHGSAQPGEGGGPMGSSGSLMTSIFGWDFNAEPDFPVIDSGPAHFAGGTSGVNASAEARIEALERALAVFKDVDYKILVVSDVYVDDPKIAYNSATGERIRASAGLLDTLYEHQHRVSANGASGIVYASVRPMSPATAVGRYTDEQKVARVRELIEVDTSDPLRPATILSQFDSLPDFFLFDAPMRITSGGNTIVTDGAAFFAGMRSALPNNRTLYQNTLPNSVVEPLYRYDVADGNMPGLLSEARINTWDDRRGEIRMADERTAAGMIMDERGQMVPSSFKSGPALLAAKEFLQKSVRRLRNLLGPLPAGGVDVLRGTVVTELRSVAGSVVGIQGLDLDDQADIVIRATGGNTLGMWITVMLLVNGELRTIDIRVGAMTDIDTNVQDAAPTAIPTAS